jgi:hypothetical protein
VVQHTGAEDELEEKAVTVTLPREEIKPAWRAAVLAYRHFYRVAAEDRLAPDAALETFRGVLPDLSKEQAKVETTQAIAFAAANHTKWFWRGVYGPDPSL